MKKLLLLVCVMMARVAVASSATDLESLLSDIHTMQATFTQIIYDNKHRPIQTSHGKLNFSRPNKFRWEVVSPIPQLIIADGSRLFIYDKDLEQLTIRRFQKAVGVTPALLLSHDKAVGLEKEYAITQVQNGASESNWYHLVPKNKESPFAWVEMGFDKKQISGMRMQDNLGHLTDIDFKNIVSNRALSDSLFTFKAPKGVDVIDETKKR